MNERTAKMLRRVIGRKVNLKASRQYMQKNAQGTIINAPGSPRAVYQKAKKSL